MDYEELKSFCEKRAMENDGYAVALAILLNQKMKKSTSDGDGRSSVSERRMACFEKAMLKLVGKGELTVTAETLHERLNKAIGAGVKPFGVAEMGRCLSQTAVVSNYKTRRQSTTGHYERVFVISIED